MGEEITKTRSILVRKFGGYEALQVVDHPLSPLSDDQVEVKVEFCGVNFADLYTRQGLMLDLSPPFVLGIECSGTVSALGAQAGKFKVGQRVVCYDYKGGLFRDVVRLSQDKVFGLPDHISCETAAGVIVNYLTAYSAIFDAGNLKENERILILSCTGGVGLACIQLAKTIGKTTIFGTGSPEKQTKCQDLNINFLLNSTLLEELPKLEKFDLIISNQSGPLLDHLTNSLKPLGRLVLLGANNILQNEKKLSKLALLKAWWSTSNVAWHNLIMKNQIVAGLHLGKILEENPGKIQDNLEKIFNLFEQNQLELVLHGKYNFSQVIEASKQLGERKNFGKVLLSNKIVP